MPTQLDNLLSEIDPVRVYDRIEARVNHALDNFHVEWRQIRNRDDFQECVAMFLFQASLPSHAKPGLSGMPLSMWWSQAVPLLNQEYGPSGAEVGYQNARLGVEGAIHGVLKVLAKRLIEEHSRRVAQSHISDFWNNLSPWDQKQAVVEYISKFGQLLPPEVRGKDPVAIWVEFPRLLEQHPHSIRALRRLHP